MASSEITLEAVSSVSQISAEDWNACANPSPTRVASTVSTRWLHPLPQVTPALVQHLAITICFARIFLCIGSVRIGLRADRLGAAPSAGPARRHDIGHCALLPEITLAGRIRVRPRLGRRLRTGRRALLSEAAGLGSVYPGGRSAPLDPRRRRCRPDRHRAGERAGRAVAKRPKPPRLT